MHVCGSVGGVRDRFTPHVRGEMKAISQAGHFSRFRVSLAGCLALVQFNFFKAHRLVLSPPHPFFLPPTKSLLS